MTKNETNNNWFGEGIIITASPFIAYSITFAYESGYAEYFNYPTHLIETTLTGVLLGLVSLMAGVAALYIPLEFMHFFWDPIPKVLKSSFRKLLGIPLFVMIGLLKFQYSKLFWIPFTLAALGLVLIEFGFPIFTVKQKVPYLQKLEIENKRDFQHDSLIDKFAKKVGVQLFIVAFLGIFAFMLASAYGYFNARTQMAYYVVNDSKKEMVLLRAYGDKWVMSEFDRVNKILFENRIIILTNEMSGMHFKKEYLGIMKTAESKNSGTDEN